jgi:hypothetical protein
MAQVYRTLRVAPSDEGVLGVVIDAPPMNLIGPELAHDPVMLIGALESGQETRVMVLQGLQTRGPLELDLGDRIGALNTETDLIGGVDQPGELMPSERGLRSAPFRISASRPDDWSGADGDVQP